MLDHETFEIAARAEVAIDHPMLELTSEELDYVGGGTGVSWDIDILSFSFGTA